MLVALEEAFPYFARCLISNLLAAPYNIMDNMYNPRIMILHFMVVIMTWTIPCHCHGGFETDNDA